MVSNNVSKVTKYLYNLYLGTFIKFTDDFYVSNSLNHLKQLSSSHYNMICSWAFYLPTTRMCPKWKPGAVFPRQAPSRPMSWTPHTVQPHTGYAFFPLWNCSPPVSARPWWSISVYRPLLTCSTLYRNSSSSVTKS